MLIEIEDGLSKNVTVDGGRISSRDSRYFKQTNSSFITRDFGCSEKECSEKECKVNVTVKLYSEDELVYGPETLEEVEIKCSQGMDRVEVLSSTSSTFLTIPLSSCFLAISARIEDKG
jgi:hypothetical protein